MEQRAHKITFTSITHAENTSAIRSNDKDKLAGLTSHAEIRMRVCLSHYERDCLLVHEWMTLTCDVVIIVSGPTNIVEILLMQLAMLS